MDMMIRLGYAKNKDGMLPVWSSFLGTQKSAAFKIQILLKKVQIQMEQNITRLLGRQKDAKVCAGKNESQSCKAVVGKETYRGVEKNDERTVERQKQPNVWENWKAKSFLWQTSFKGNKEEAIKDEKRESYYYWKRPSKLAGGKVIRAIFRRFQWAIKKTNKGKRQLCLSSLLQDRRGFGLQTVLSSYRL